MAKDGLKEAAIMYGVEMLETVASRYIRYVHDSQLETVLVFRMLPRSSWCFSFAGHDTLRVPSSHEDQETRHSRGVKR